MEECFQTTIWVWCSPRSASSSRALQPERRPQQHYHECRKHQARRRVDAQGKRVLTLLLQEARRPDLDQRQENQRRRAHHEHVETGEVAMITDQT